MRRNWTAEEEQYLRDHVGVIKISTIAERLGRSYSSVKNKMKRLGITNTKDETGYITFHALAKLLKVDRNTVKGWAERHGLPYIRKVTASARQFYFVHPSKFWEWAEENKEKVPFSNIEPNSLPPEPEWVPEERRKGQFMIRKRSYKRWTTKETKKVVMLRNTGFTYKEIGKKLGRSSVSIERQYKRVVSE